MKKCLPLCLLLVFFLLPISAQGQSLQEDRYSYMLNDDGTACITGYTWPGAINDLEIPATLGGRAVTAIAPYAFAGGSVRTNVRIPDSVRTIGEFAFQSCDILSVYIPDSVEEIGIGAFSYCASLARIIVEPENARYASVDDALYNKPERALVACVPAAKVPEGIVSIADYACAGITVTAEDVFPASLVSIGECAFSAADIKITALTANGRKRTVHPSLLTGYLDYEGYDARLLPEGVCTLGGNAFAGATISFAAEGYADICLYLYPDSLTSMGEYAFNGCWIEGISGLTEYAETDIVLGQGLEIIPLGAFANLVCATNRGVTMVIPESIGRVENIAFAYMRCGPFASYSFDSDTDTGHPLVLSSIDGGEVNIDSMGAGCFVGASVDVPLCVGEMGASAFAYTSLLEVTVRDGVTYIAEEAFRGASVPYLTLPSSLSALEAGAFCETSNLALLDLAHTQIVAIPEGAFFCASIWQISLPDTLREIGPSAFEGAMALDTLALPAGVESIGEGAFRSSGVANVQLQEGLRTISDQAFYDCPALTSISIPASVESIGRDAFDQESITLEVPADSYAVGWAQQNNIAYRYTQGDDLSWLTGESATPPPAATAADSFPTYDGDPRGYFAFITGSSYETLCDYFAVCAEKNIDCWQQIYSAYRDYGADPERLQEEFNILLLRVDIEDRSISLHPRDYPTVSVYGYDSHESAEFYAEGFAEYSNRTTFACGNSCVIVYMDD